MTSGAPSPSTADSSYVGRGAEDLIDLDKIELSASRQEFRFATANTSINPKGNANTKPATPTSNSSSTAVPASTSSPVASSTPPSRLPFSKPLTSIISKSSTSSPIGAEDSGTLVSGSNATSLLMPSKNGKGIGTTMISTAATWAGRLTRDFLHCYMCQKPCLDPVEFVPRRAIVCRNCLFAKGLPSSSLRELPLSILSLVAEVQQQAACIAGVLPTSRIAEESSFSSSTTAGQLPSEDASVSAATGFRGHSHEVKSLNSTLNRNTVGMTTSEKMGEGGLSSISSLGDIEAEGRPSSSSPVLAVNPGVYVDPTVGIGASGLSLGKGGETCIAAQPPKTFKGKEHSTISAASTSTSSSSSASSSMKKRKHSKSVDLEERTLAQSPEKKIAAQQELITKEQNERQQIISLEKGSLQSRVKEMGGLLKSTADMLYESSEYEEALQMYSCGVNICLKDGGASVLPLLYSSRSAVYFMLLQYQKCCDDCDRAIKAVTKEATVAKMCERGARSAWVLGNLSLALDFLQRVPQNNRDERYAKKLEKCQKGKYILEFAEKLFGKVEADTYFRMLLALFSDSFAFRLRYAESLMKQGLFRSAIDVLLVITPKFRPPVFCAALARCYYQSGFEYFKEAKDILRQVVGRSEECRELLEQIRLVDKGKQEGNENFSRRSFEAAAKHYTASISKAEGNKRILRILYSNRAAANKELGKYQDSVDDCTKALENDPLFWKAYSRRARCLLELNDTFAAVEDFKKAIENDKSSEDPDLKKELQEAEKRLAQEENREKDYYYQLGLPKNATDKEIKIKYRELSLKWHPDKWVSKGGMERDRAEVKFKRISEAYYILSDPQRRRDHDFKSTFTSSRNEFSFSRNKGATMSRTYW